MMHPHLLPSSPSPIQTGNEGKTAKSSGSDIGAVPGALIALGAVVFAAAAAAIVYLFCAKRRKRTLDDSVDGGNTTKTIVIPRYEPVFVEPNFKEYETQVLQMSVPTDDLADMHGGGGNNSHNNHNSTGSFNLDSISYITKDRISYSRLITNLIS